MNAILMHRTPVSGEALADWRDDPEASALLASCAANPPPMRPQLAPFSHANRGDETVMVYDDRDERVDRLRLISNEAFCAVEAAEGGKAFLRTWVGVSDAIERACVRRAAK